VDGFANAYALKIRGGARVTELVLLDPARMRVEVDSKTRERTYCFFRTNGDKVEIPQGNLIHVRGWDPNGSPQARSPIERHRDDLGKTSNRARMEARYLSNDARPGVIIQMPANVTRAQAEEFLELWDARHKGDPGKANVVGGGATITTLPISFKDAQFVESSEFAVTDIARETIRPFVEIMAWAVRLHLMPRLQRIEGAFGDDPDLFGPTSKFRPYFDVSELLRGDAATMAAVFHQLVQVGVMTPNEARLPLGLEPIDGGDDLQSTPVGGAPNATDTAPPTPEAKPAPVPPPASTPTIPPRR
jgi:phage portal protein BeeE